MKSTCHPRAAPTAQTPRPRRDASPLAFSSPGAPRPEATFWQHRFSVGPLGAPPSARRCSEVPGAGSASRPRRESRSASPGLWPNALCWSHRQGPGQGEGSVGTAVVFGSEEGVQVPGGRGRGRESRVQGADGCGERRRRSLWGEAAKQRSEGAGPGWPCCGAGRGVGSVRWLTHSRQEVGSGPAAKGAPSSGLLVLGRGRPLAFRRDSQLSCCWSF